MLLIRKYIFTFSYVTFHHFLSLLLFLTELSFMNCLNPPACPNVCEKCMREIFFCSYLFKAHWIACLSVHLSVCLSLSLALSVCLYVCVCVWLRDSTLHRVQYSLILICILLWVYERQLLLHLTFSLISQTVGKGGFHSDPAHTDFTLHQRQSLNLCNRLNHCTLAAL